MKTMSKKRTDVDKSKKATLLLRKNKSSRQNSKKENKTNKNSFLNYIQKQKAQQISNDYNCLSKTNKIKIPKHTDEK